MIASFRCYDNSDVIATLITTNFHLYLVQLWWQFFQNFVYGAVLYAQTWELLALENCIEPPFKWHQWFLQPIKDSTTILFVALCRCQNWLSWNNTSRNYYSKSPLFSGNYWTFSAVRLFFCSEYQVRSKEKINKEANGIPYLKTDDMTLIPTTK